MDDDERPVGFLRGLEPGPEDVAAARRCRLRHEETRGDEVDRQPADRWVILTDAYGRVPDRGMLARDATPSAPGALWHNPGITFLTFDAGMPLNHAIYNRPPDHRIARNTYDPYDTLTWYVRGDIGGQIESSPEGIEIDIRSDRIGVDEMIDLQDCLAAAQAHQRMLREMVARDERRAAAP